MVLVTVVVVGDIGRSPRMQYHCASLASHGYEVEVVGYEGSKPIKEITDDDRISLRYLKDCPDFQNYFPRVVSYVFKAVWQIMTILICLTFKRRSDFVLVQSPPAVPTLFVCWLYCLISRAVYIIDWHNYAYKNLAVTLTENHPLVKISRWFEGCFGRKSHQNLCVTKAMKCDLKRRWNIEATVLYDRPFDIFSSVSLEMKHSFFKRIGKEYPIFASISEHADATVFTACLPNNLIALKQSRPALLVSSTSWSQDEDFSILLTALIQYDTTNDCNLPKLICVITGKGPMKEFYNKQIKERDWTKVTIITPWLETEDYPIMLGSADLGVCLHTSTSGLDLPMKVVDMFGCGLPVTAYDFDALSELVRDQENGTVFKTSTELFDQLQKWFKDFPDSIEAHSKFRKNIENNFMNLKWHENWTLHALTLFKPKSKQT